MSESEPLRLHRASPIGDRVAPKMRIEIHAEIANCTGLGAIEAQRQLYQREAQALAHALFVSLPGGTLDALLVAMMQRKCSTLRVSHTMLQSDGPKPEDNYEHRYTNEQTED